MKVKELLDSYSLIDFVTIKFYAPNLMPQNGLIMSTPNYGLVKPMVEDCDIEQWFCSKDSIDITLTSWNPGKIVMPVSDNLIGIDERNSSADSSNSATVNGAPLSPKLYMKVKGLLEEQKEEHAKTLEKLFPSQDPSDHDNDDIRNLKLTRRSFNCLHRAGIQSIGDLREVTANELMDIRNFGKHCLQEVQDELNAYGLHLKED